MKNTIRQVFHSSKFVTGFVIFVIILLTMLIYPLINPGNPLEMIGVGTFAKPGTYVSLYDAARTSTETLRLADADEKRLNQLLSDSDRISMVDWFSAMGIDISGLDISDTDALLDLWKANYTPESKPKGMTQAKRNYYKRLNNAIKEISASDTLVITDRHAETGDLEEIGSITKTDYVNVGQVANVKSLPLGTDNFGRDVLKELVSAAGTSIVIGMIAGIVATLIGLTLGLLSGYVGGLVDDLIMFVTNIFTVIPGFVLLILISYSIGQEQRGATVVAMVIGFTSWTWTARSVRSQVISLRNRDHVNLSKLSGHSLVRIILTDILPYIASYVVMAFILQVSSGILAEAQLSLLGLGPKTTTTPTLGLMMNWAMLYSAHTNGSWWAYFPVILTITCISFSLNLMNTGLDQVFNPTLRD
ncbi:ABC transporter permease [Clostridiales bacterium FE2011]|nr:ABC transporter permease [Clostridiales bacterium FE2011]QTE73761.1 ABC transporter permease [Clostridiales bacterium FE2010]